MATDRDRVKDYNDCYYEASEYWSAWQALAYDDYGHYLGKQWDDTDLKALKDEKRRPSVHNKIKKNINLVVGHQARNRMTSIVRPQETSDQEVADIYSDLVIWANRTSNAPKALTKAFKGSMICGLSVLNPYMDYSVDLINGDPKIAVESFNSILIDPKFSDQTLSDANYVTRRRYVTREEGKMMIPSFADLIDDLPLGVSDEKFPYMALNDLEMTNLMAYDEFWTRTTKKVFLLIEKPTGYTQKWRGTKAELKEFLNRFPFYEVQEIYDKAIEQVILIQNEFVTSYVNPYGIGDFPFVPVLADYLSEFDDQRYKLQGMVRGMKDPQIEVNKLYMSMVDITRRQANTGYKYKIGSVANPEDLAKNGQGVIIAIKKEGQMGDVEKIPAGEIPQSLPVLAGIMAKDLQQDAGISDELLGTGELGNSQISGTLAKVRAYNSQTTLQPYFDNLSFSQQLVSTKFALMIQANFTPEKIKRITEREVPQNFYNFDIAKFDISIEEGLETDTQKALHFTQLMQARANGIPIANKSIIRALPVQDKRTIEEDFEEEQQLLEQQQEEIRKQKEIELRLANAKVIKELSLAEQERRRGVADEKLAVWRESEAEKNNAQADLDRVETIKRIQEIDIKNFMELLSLLERVQSLDVAKARQTVKEDIAQTDASLQRLDTQVKQGFSSELLNLLQNSQNLGNV